MKEVKLSEWKFKRNYFQRGDIKYRRDRKYRECILDKCNRIVLSEWFQEEFRKEDNCYVKVRKYYYFGVAQFGKKRPLRDYFWIQSDNFDFDSEKVSYLYFRNGWYSVLLNYYEAILRFNQQLQEKYRKNLPAELIITAKLMQKN